MILRELFKTRLVTLMILEIIPLSFGFWMVDRTISAISLTYVDFYRISNLCYILAPMFLIYFVDLIAKGIFTWKSVGFTFYSGALTVAALFIDEYTVGYNPNSGWVQVAWKQPLFYIFLYLYILLIVLVFLRHLFIAYSNNRGENKHLMKQIVLIFTISILGIFIFNSLRSLRLIDYPYLNSVDTLFFTLGFGMISWHYLKRPYLFHLDLLDVQLYGLFVFDNHGPLLYSYEFQAASLKSADKDLFVGALAGFDTLFKEVLAGDQNLKEVRQESNIIILESGKGITFGLVTNRATLMSRNWLCQFRVAFEKNFKADLAQYFATQRLDFETKPDTLVRQIFLKI
jgi:hypothetical protein